ncbi:MAG: hypothetical protein HGB03_00700 [Candidatus Yonathbacteria bacterium]|nr:hypothetical protein [Candidatus Yonathbacteria bacterium]NTW47781.1 hypothetical protein [Candidatus Yonathbacteria bacterium]
MKKSFFVAMGMFIFVVAVLYGVTKITPLLQKVIEVIETAIDTTVSFWRRASMEDIFLIVLIVLLLQFISWILRRRQC